jgi:hypothetical protein
MDAEVAGRQPSSPQIATMKINSDFIARRLYSKEILGRLRKFLNSSKQP